MQKDFHYDLMSGALPPLCSLLALLRWKVPSWTEVKQALPAASFHWGKSLPTDWAVSLPPAATEPLLRPPASWSVPWDLHSDFLQLAFPFLSPSYLTWASLHLKCTHIRPCLSLNKYVFIEMSLLWMKPTVKNLQSCAFKKMTFFWKQSFPKEICPTLSY